MAVVASNNNANLITELNDDDVLLGRGKGPSNFIGNKRFLALCKARQEEYVSKESFREKALMANEILNTIQRKNGRFLQLVKTDKRPPRNVIKEGVWRKVPKAVALEKCKQALREQRDGDKNKEGTQSVAATGGSGSSGINNDGTHSVAAPGGSDPSVLLRMLAVVASWKEATDEGRLFTG